MRFCMLAIVSIFSFLSSFAFAYDRKDAVTFTVGGGYVNFASKRHIQNAGFGMGILGYDFTDKWGIEGMLDLLTTRSNLPINEGKTIRGTLFAIDAIYHFAPICSFEPFVLAGPGITGLNPNGTDANNEGNINAGVGVLMYINSSIAFRVEARDFYTIVGGKNDLIADGGVTILV